MRTRTQPRQRKPRPHTTLAAFVADAAAIREISTRTGLRRDATLSALVRLFDLSTPALRKRAGFPIQGVARISSPVTPPDNNPRGQHGAPLTAPEAQQHAGNCPTREAAA